MKIKALEVSKLVMDEYTEKILVGTFKRAKSAKQLSREHNIPLRLCYEKIRLLEKLGFLRRVSIRIGSRGEETTVFRSQLKQATIFHHDGNIKVRCEFKSGKVKEYEKELEIVR